MKKPFVTIIADVPWKYGDGLKAMKSAGPGAATHYRCMTIDEMTGLAAVNTTDGPFTIAGHPIADDALLGFWVTDPFLVNEPWSVVPRAWGFTPKALVTWVKGRITPKPHERVAKLVLHVGQGRYTRGCTEHLVICARGKATSLIQSHSEPNVFIAERTKHSQKPDEAYRLLERLSPGPYLELFARRPRPGWTCWGNEL